MSFRDSLQVVRRRLLVVVAALVLGATVGWVSASGETHRKTTFRATHTLIYEAHGGQNYNLEQIALLATSGAVPSRVAARLAMDRGQVRAAVSASADAQVATISVTGRSSDGSRAVQIADVTAQELVAELLGRDQAVYDTEINRLTDQVNAARDRLTRTRVPAEQAAARADIDAAERALQQYRQIPGPPKAQLRTLEAATASPLRSAGVQAPNSKPVRALLLGGVGLLIGLAGAFALDRLDTRIRSKSRAEEAFGLPVVAEVPPIPKNSQGQLLTRQHATSPAMEAYRALRTYVALWAPETGEDDGRRVIVVTSPAAGEGKTTTVAHLAAMLAEIGRSVVVVSADLRRPRLHQFFERSGAPGLADVLAGTPGAPAFDDLNLATPVRGVRLVPSGPPRAARARPCGRSAPRQTTACSSRRGPALRSGRGRRRAASRARRAWAAPAARRSRLVPGPHPPANLSFRRRATSGVTNALTSPPKRAISRIRLEDRNECSGAAATNRVSTARSRMFICAIWSS
jgi:capsular polysaccharide biosynthesis protein